MEYLVKWQEKDNPAISRFIAVRDYGAEVLCQLLKENGYEYSVRPMPEPYKKPLSKTCEHDDGVESYIVNDTESIRCKSCKQDIVRWDRRKKK